MRKKKVLYILNNAPLYRESFLRLLGEQLNLKVIAGKGTKNMKMPDKRKGYNYREFKVPKKIPIYFSLNQFSNSLKYNPEAVIIGWNLHDITRYILFFIFKFAGKKVYFSGIFYGKNNSIFKKKIMIALLNCSDGILAYSNMTLERLKKDGVSNKVISFNNNDIDKFYEKKPYNNIEGQLNLAYVGRNQERKKIYRLVEYALKNRNIILHLIGPGMSDFKENSSDNIVIKEEIYKDELTDYLLKEVDVICIPGSGGLLALLAAQHSIPLIVDKKSDHGPEVSIAYEANQVFTDWQNKTLVSKALSDFYKLQFRKLKGKELQNVAKEKYNINYMVSIYKEILGGF